MHEHCHEHNHDHCHEHHSPEEALALLAYMLVHNRQHAQELHELAHSVDEAAAALLHEAVEAFNAGNDKLEKVLDLLEGKI
jgi:hypothetical protein